MTKQFIEPEAKKVLAKMLLYISTTTGLRQVRLKHSHFQLEKACSTYAGRSLGLGSPSTFHILVLFRLKFSILFLISNLQ